MNRETLDRWCETGILVLLLAILIYSPLATGSVRPQDFLIVQWLAIAMLALWGARCAITRTQRLHWPLVCWPVLGFILYAVVCYLAADVEFVARQEMIRVLVYGVLFFAILNNCRSQGTIHLIGMTLILLATAIALYAGYQFMTESEHVWHFVKPEGYRKRGSGTFICPNHGAGYLEMILPLALAYTLMGRVHHLTRIFLGYATLVIFMGIAVTISRGAWAATAITLLVLFFSLLKQRRCRFGSLLLFSGLACIAVVFFFKADLSRNHYQRLAWAANAEDYRFELWPPAFRMWQDHFWFGIGPGHFDYRFRQYRPLDADLQGRPDRVHNDYLNTLVDWGLVGGVLMAGVVILFWVELLRGRLRRQKARDDPRAKPSERSPFLPGAVLGLLAILLHSFVDFNMHVPANAVLAVTLLALASGQMRVADERDWQTVRLPWRIPVMATLAAILAYLGCQATGRSIEMSWLSQARTRAPGNDALTALKNAFRIEPKNFETAHRIGETLRSQSWDGRENYQALAREALTWFQRAADLNPHDPHSVIGAGMCLDWLKEHEAAKTYFDRAHKLDPNGYYTLAHLGWHYVQVQDYGMAKKWFERSLGVKPSQNPIAQNYLAIANEHLIETGALNGP